MKKQLRVPIRVVSRSKLGTLVTFFAFGTLGTWLLVASHAATPTASIEAESGSVSSAAGIVADSTASGSSAVKFGAAASCKAPAGTLSVAVCGNDLADQNGAIVQLRGVNRSGTQYACVEGSFFDGPTDSTSLNYIKSWGANAVRVSLNEDCWLGINGVAAAYSGVNYQNAILAYVGRLNALGLRVIIDLHWAAPGTTLTDANLDQLPMPDRDHSNTFWTGVANAYKNNPSVIFDLFNEPYPDSNKNTTAAWTCLRDGGTCPGVTVNGASYVAAGMQEMLNAVRATGATNVVMIGGPQYAGVFHAGSAGSSWTTNWWKTYKPTDPLNQLAASIHIYYDTPSSPEWSPCYKQSCWTNSIAPIAAEFPVIIGEVGEHDCDHGLIDGTAMSPTRPSLLDWSDQHGVSYLAWSWISNGGGNCATEPSLITDYVGTPSNYGIGIKNHLLSLPH